MTNDPTIESGADQEAPAITDTAVPTLVSATEAKVEVTASDVLLVATKPSKQTSKSAAVQKMLSRNRGASLTEIMAATHWQPHSTRAFLTGLRKKGLVVLRETRGNGDTCWRIER